MGPVIETLAREVSVWPDHAQVSTTVDIYAHVIEAADQKSADILGETFLKKA